MKNTHRFLEYKVTGVSRKQLLEIMKELGSVSWVDNGDEIQKKDLIDVYIPTFEKLICYMENTTYKDNYNAKMHTIVVNILSDRQLHLSDVVLEYMIDDVHKNLPKICHEIGDYIHDYGNSRDDFNYAELILLQKIVTLLLKKIRN